MLRASVRKAVKASATTRSKRWTERRKERTVQDLERENGSIECRSVVRESEREKRVVKALYSCGEHQSL